jgi:hypothetical protein
MKNAPVVKDKKSDESNLSVEKKGPGRPKKDLDVDLIKKLASIHCTKEEIASVLGCHRDTLYARFSDILQQGDEEGKMSLKRKMHEVAMSGNVQMLIWLSKQRLGYKDRQPDEVAQTTFNVYVNEVPE